MTIKIDFIPGMPPGFGSTDSNGDDSSAKTNQVMKDSMPIVHIEPGTPEYDPQGGIDMFYRGKAFDGKDGYHELLKKHGFELSSSVHSHHLTLAYLADSFPTDTFTNEYGENFFQSISNIASEGAAALSQALGVKTATGMVPKAIEAISGMGAIGKAIGSTAQAGYSGLSNLIAPLAGGKGLQIVDRLMAGGRIDFPMLWKNSTFQPSYTMTVRLYNPNPSSQESTEKYILGPIAAIMLLGVPISDDNSTYSWPFIHSFISPGIYKLDPAFVSNITIIKGGDQQQIGLNQKLGLVDVRIDIGSLFSSMMASKTGTARRPTVASYIDVLRGNKEVKSLSQLKPSAVPTGYEGDILSEARFISQVQTAQGIDEGGEVSIISRVSTTVKTTADSIINSIPGGFKIGGSLLTK